MRPQCLEQRLTFKACSISIALCFLEQEREGSRSSAAFQEVADICLVMCLWKAPQLKFENHSPSLTFPLRFILQGPGGLSASPNLWSGQHFMRRLIASASSAEAHREAVGEPKWVQGQVSSLKPETCLSWFPFLNPACASGLNIWPGIILVKNRH